LKALNVTLFTYEEASDIFEETFKAAAAAARRSVSPGAPGRQLETAQRVTVVHGAAPRAARRPAGNY
jgi:hypothetical protein